MESYTHRRVKLEKKIAWKAICPSIRGNSCPICFVNLEDRNYIEAAILPVCKHAFCVQCIRKWSDLKRNCPLCNANFDSWLRRQRLSSPVLRQEFLPSWKRSEGVRVEVGGHEVGARRVFRRTRIESNRGRTRPVPWRRSFGQRGSMTPDVIAQRKLEWRASIYRQRLKSVPLSSEGCLDQAWNVLRKNGIREKILQRIEPWIRRELQAVLGDPDPTIIVHVATSQFIAFLDEKARVPLRQLVFEDNFAAPLRPFLLDKTDIFWHELRCFAESSYNMETYDAVVEYK